ncbi:hypothetical protein COO60DRAFT_238063 [Scenedesmus sp. NREL 46B-D3]|nr:hypothetical protein COO60DRAFT_238063 [Scenedesmus sp. NREL 46B-D3]
MPAMHVAVEEAGVQLSPAGSFQQQLHDGTSPAAALHVRGGQRQRQAVMQVQQQTHLGAAAAAAACVGALRDANSLASAVLSCTQDAVAAPLPAGCFGVSEVSGMARESLIAAAAAAPAAGDCRDDAAGGGSAAAVGRAAASVQALLQDGVYVAELLASLPGVDAGSAHVQHAVRQLQGDREGA